MPATQLAGKLVRPWCGIGRPESLIHTLEKLGARVMPGRIAGDHTSPRGRLETSETSLWVATEKDAARGGLPSGVAVLSVDIKKTSGEAYLQEWLKGAWDRRCGI